MSIQLLAIVGVPKEQRVQCQRPSCGRGVYKCIHVARDGKRITVLGAVCFSRLYHGLISANPRYVSGDGRKLSDAERQLLIENTQHLLDLLEAEHLKAIAGLEIRAANERPVVVQSPRRLPFSDWLKQLSPDQRATFSVIRMELREELRAKGINSNFPGWAMDVDARSRFKAEKKQGPITLRVQQQAHSRRRTAWPFTKSRPTS